MDALKLYFLLFLNAFKNWGLGLYAESKKLVLNVANRIGLALHAAVSAVLHVVYIPVHAALWVWGCAKASWNALASIWRR